MPISKRTTINLFVVFSVCFFILCLYLFRFSAGSLYWIALSGFFLTAAAVLFSFSQYFLNSKLAGFKKWLIPIFIVQTIFFIGLWVLLLYAAFNF